ncbi:MAG: secondary thiamine-phosphate synthase enzyme YjbQ [Alphaproteobacteria bacterium]|nr:secondary thiamine-phosphate synthase enzyme YjbQ [Alphaproteobacteria bacterium]HJP21002.1 secondary thiamine-phosphate synthase enzyme YjbQ [Alphaproteobacteria bacterium]
MPNKRLSFETRGQGLYEITREVAAWLAGQKVSEGLLTAFIQHTSASLTIQENADPAVLRDLQEFFADIAPEDRAYHHRSEGPDDMPAHIRAALTQSHLAVPVIGGRLALGTWQGIFLFEHRSHPHTRQVILHLGDDK